MTNLFEIEQQRSINKEVLDDKVVVFLKGVTEEGQWDGFRGGGGGGESGGGGARAPKPSSFKTFF